MVLQSYIYTVNGLTVVFKLGPGLFYIIYYPRFPLFFLGLGVHV